MTKSKADKEYDKLMDEKPVVIRDVITDDPRFRAGPKPNFIKDPKGAWIYKKDKIKMFSYDMKDEGKWNHMMLISTDDFRLYVYMNDGIMQVETKKSKKSEKRV